MHVFVTGGSGLVGTSLIPHLIAAGHKVSALARTEKSAATVASLGATPVPGGHTDLSVLSSAAATADAAIHLAFNHEIAFSGGMEQACDEDRAAISAICDAFLAGDDPRSKTFVNSSGTFGNEGRDELARKVPSALSHRARSEVLTAEYAAKGIAAYNLRLPPVVHGPKHEHPFVATQIAVARKNGYAAYVGNGANVWPSVHVDDAAKLYVLALGRGAPNGSSLHAVDEGGIPTREIAEFVARKLGVEAKSKTPEEVGKAGYGMIGTLMGFDNPTTSELTREWTGWAPKEYGLFKELEGYSWSS